jgi:hypothetical protein
MLWVAALNTAEDHTSIATMIGIGPSALSEPHLSNANSVILRWFSLNEEGIFGSKICYMPKVIGRRENANG